MLIVHTSDWHLGQNLYEQSRLEEQRCFLQWLKSLIQERQADVLLVSGDIYDTSAPPNAARKLYYDFLRDVRDMPGGICRHVILTGGNHDSPSVLNASAQYLESDNIHVIGRAQESPKDEVLLLKGEDNEPYLIVCAVPYLREADLDRTHFGNDPAQRDAYIAKAVLSHYEQAAAWAESLNASLKKRVPV
ncbi:MAG: exonuclease subunit SbcD, partial [Desulfovibrionaceae bacterium]|nr:exonuclease subunit SbcD [Desulfovibrionaceae bacterium]